MPLDALCKRCQKVDANLEIIYLFFFLLAKFEIIFDSFMNAFSFFWGPPGGVVSIFIFPLCPLPLIGHLTEIIHNSEYMQNSNVLEIFQKKKCARTIYNMMRQIIMIFQPL